MSENINLSERLNELMENLGFAGNCLANKLSDDNKFQVNCQRKALIDRSVGKATVHCALQHRVCVRLGLLLRLEVSR